MFFRDLARAFSLSRARARGTQEQAPFISLTTLIFAPTTYFTAGLHPSGFLTFFLSLLLSSYSGTAVGYAIGSYFTADLIGIITPLIVFPAIILSGVVSVNLASWVGWLEHLNYFNHFITICLVTDFRGHTFEDNKGDPVRGGELLKQYKMDRPLLVCWFFLVFSSVFIHTVAMSSLTLRVRATANASAAIPAAITQKSP